MNWVDMLAEFASEVRESSLKRLRAVPIGFENWRVHPDSMSFADTAKHLIDCDEWLFDRLAGSNPEPLRGLSGCTHIADRRSYDNLLENLDCVGQRRRDAISRLDDSALSRLVLDTRFGREVTVWWVIVRGNLDHEIHHRGQIAAWLRIIQTGEGNKQ
jgi:uncharacterized damage-inducible protein DinB